MERGTAGKQGRGSSLRRPRGGSWGPRSAQARAWRSGPCPSASPGPHCLPGGRPGGTAAAVSPGPPPATWVSGAWAPSRAALTVPSPGAGVQWVHPEVLSALLALHPQEARVTGSPEVLSEHLRPGGRQAFCF